MSTLTDRLAAARLRRARYRNGGASPTIIVRLAREIAAWRRRSRERQELARMTGRDLQDLGITPGDALRELAKPFWRD